MTTDLSINSLCVVVGECYTPNEALKYEWKVHCLAKDNDGLNDGLEDLKNEVLRTASRDPMVGIMAQCKAYPARGNMQLFRVVKSKARYGAEWSIGSALF